MNLGWYGWGGGQFGGKSVVRFGFMTDRAYGVSGLVNFWLQVLVITHMSQLLLLGKFEYGGGPIFKVVLEC